MGTNGLTNGRFGHQMWLSWDASFLCVPVPGRIEFGEKQGRKGTKCGKTAPHVAGRGIFFMHENVISGLHCGDIGGEMEGTPEESKDSSP